MSNIVFESPLEEMMHEPIKKLAEKYNFEFIYQLEINGTSMKSWFEDKVFDTLGNYDEQTAEELEEWARDNAVDTHYSYEKYRIDFALIKKGKIKIAIELDGENFHNEKADDERDDYLDSLGFRVLRFKSDRIIGEKARQKTLNEIENFLIKFSSEVMKEKVWGSFTNR
ncbi:DUF559 domain-containing protein [archaeon]|nr:MAG: DUF559 domain-containing protein [archaeon]